MASKSGIITVQEAKKLQANWNSTRAIDIERGQGAKDPNCVTFNLEELQSFIDTVRKNATTENPGIRVYFAAYDNEETDKATVFLCASESDDGNAANDYSISPLNRGNGGWPPMAY